MCLLVIKNGTQQCGWIMLCFDVETIKIYKYMYNLSKGVWVRRELIIIILLLCLQVFTTSSSTLYYILYFVSYGISCHYGNFSTDTC